MILTRIASSWLAPEHLISPHSRSSRTYKMMSSSIHLSCVCVSNRQLLYTRPIIGLYNIATAVIATIYGSSDRDETFYLPANISHSNRRVVKDKKKCWQPQSWSSRCNFFRRLFFIFYFFSCCIYKKGGMDRWQIDIISIDSLVLLSTYV